jgi:3-hydroxyacyl-[acyl-carrier-protein] dehydratase
MTKQHFSYDQLRQQLAVSPPLLMLDRIQLDSDKGRASASKYVTRNESVFNGHFPDYPVLPGVLQIAAMAQSSRVLFNAMFPGDGHPYVTRVRRVKFRSSVQPGMVLAIECSYKKQNEDGSVEFEIKNTVVGGKLASSGFISLAWKDPDWFVAGDEDEPCPLLAEVDDSYLDADAIMAIIPHRYPFMLVDRAYGLDDPASVLGYKNVSGNDPLVQATYPAMYPGYLQLESGAQLGCAAVLAQPENRDKLGLYMSIDDAVFHRPALPGEQIVIRCSCEMKGRFGIADGIFYVGKQIIAESSTKFAIVPKDEMITS